MAEYVKQKLPQKEESSPKETVRLDVELQEEEKDKVKDIRALFNSTITHIKKESKANVAEHLRVSQEWRDRRETESARNMDWRESRPDQSGPKATPRENRPA